jgi:hypothetical protein
MTKKCRSDTFGLPVEAGRSVFASGLYLDIVSSYMLRCCFVLDFPWVAQVENRPLSQAAFAVRWKRRRRQFQNGLAFFLLSGDNEGAKRIRIMNVRKR